MNTYGVMTSIRPIREILVVLNALNNQISNDSDNDTARVKNVNTNYSISVTSQFQLFDLNHTLTNTYSTQYAKDMNVLQSK